MRVHRQVSDHGQCRAITHTLVTGLPFACIRCHTVKGPSSFNPPHCPVHRPSPIQSLLRRLHGATEVDGDVLVDLLDVTKAFPVPHTQSHLRVLMRSVDRLTSSSVSPRIAEFDQLLRDDLRTNLLRLVVLSLTLRVRMHPGQEPSVVGFTRVALDGLDQGWPAAMRSSASSNRLSKVRCSIWVCISLICLRCGSRRDGSEGSRRQPVRDRLVFELGLAVLMGLGGHRISISQVLVGWQGRWIPVPMGF